MLKEEWIKKRKKNICHWHRQQLSICENNVCVFSRLYIPVMLIVNLDYWLAHFWLSLAARHNINFLFYQCICNVIVNHAIWTDFIIIIIKYVSPCINLFTASPPLKFNSFFFRHRSKKHIRMNIEYCIQFRHAQQLAYSFSHLLCSLFSLNCFVLSL